MGSLPLAAAASKSSSGSYTFLLVIVVLFGLFYFVMIRPQRNKQRQVQQMQRQVEPGQQVRTTAGMYGTVVSLDDDDVVLEIAPGVEVRLMRRAILDTVPADGETGVSEPAAEEDASPAESAADSAADDGYSKDLPAGH
jgi:preprotein translocase subunit YajC